MPDAAEHGQPVEFDILLIGAGLVGLATARELLQRRPGLRLAVIDREHEVAAHQSGHNSGVIHAGMYYAPGSLRARLCVAGAASLRRFCDDRGIAVGVPGKLIVATSTAEVPRLMEILARGQQSGVPGIELVDRLRLRELEPASDGVAAVWSPTTSIVDYRAVASAYAADVRAAGGTILLDHDVKSLRHRSQYIAIKTSRGELVGRWLIGCAGLWADRLAIQDKGPRHPAIVPFRGRYWRLRARREHLARRLIYPVPDPRYPFLGVHVTPRIDGSVLVGPNALLAVARSGYRRRDVDVRDVVDVASNPAFWRFAARNWRAGLDELERDLIQARLVAGLRKLAPAIQSDDIEPGPTGVRAQALTSDGRLLDDFVVTDTARGIHVRNAPSPAATASLEIARLVADRAISRFALGA